MPWQTIRTLTTQGAEAGAPGAGAFTALDLMQPYLEIGFDSLAFAGAPSSVTLGIWRSADGRIDKLGTMTIASADIGNPAPAIFDALADAIHVRVESFVGGAGPTLSGSVRARGVRL